MGAELTSKIIELLYLIPIFLITLTVHEVAHGYAAYRLGDPTARDMGRLTLNPLKHIDPIGFIMLILFRFGWAKPVPINARNFHNPRSGTALTAAAGPAMNVIMGAFGVLLERITYLIFFNNLNLAATSSAFSNIVYSALTFFNWFAIINFSLAVFNLLPVPPLDGSRIVDFFLTPKLSYQYARLQRYSFLVLMVLLYTEILSKPISFCVNGLYSIFNFLLDLIPFLKIG